MRDYKEELEKRVAFIREILAQAKAEGIVFGNSGGKDSALVGILCKKACDNTTGIIMPCESRRNFEEDMQDGLAVAEQFGICVMTLDLTEPKQALTKALGEKIELSKMSRANINPRLRMITLYAYALSQNCLVAGTGNRSEGHMGYFTKWGDGAYDFNPIADLTVTEIYEFLRYLGAPEAIIKKAPSAGLFEGQTDESEMGVTYREIDHYLLCGKEGLSPDAVEKIEAAHAKSAHKRRMPRTYGGD